MRRKRFISVMATTALVVANSLSASTPLLIYAEENIEDTVDSSDAVVVSSDVQWKIEGVTLTISGEGAMDDYEDISETPWYDYIGEIESVVIEDGITYIGTYAFSEINGLTQVTLADSITAVGEYAFYNCSALVDINIPTGLTVIGDRAFTGTVWFEDKKEEADMVVVNNVLLYAGLSEGSVVIDSGITCIGADAFEGCYDLTSVSIPSTVTHIGANAFNACYSLTSISVPSSVTEIGAGAFGDCASLTSAKIAGKITTIGAGTFENCEYLTSVSLPSTVTHIYEYAFSGCSELKGVTLPGSLMYIGESAFDSCYNLASLSIPSKVEIIGDYAFSGCEYITTVTLPESLKEAGESAFDSSYVEKIRGKACSYAETYAADNGYRFEATNISWAVSDTTLTISGSGDMGYYPEGAPWADYYETIQKVIIKDGITSIRGYALCDFEMMTQLFLPSTLKYVDSDAVSNCSMLTELEFPEGMETIASQAFVDCAGLVSLEIPGTVTELADDGFSGCGSIENITGVVGSAAMYFAENNGYTFNPVDKITWSFYRNALTISGEGMMTDYMEKYFPSGVPWHTMSGYTTSVVINDGITTVAPNAFKNFVSLTSVNLPDGIVSIGDYAFSGCSALTDSFVMPETVTTIGEGAFSGNTGLTEIVLSDNIIKVGSEAFKDCTGVTDITLSEQMTSIESKTFSGCTGIDSISIPKGVTDIADDAFEGCTSLNKIYGYSGSVAEEFAKVNGYTFIMLGTTVELDYDITIHGDDAVVGGMIITAEDVTEKMNLEDVDFVAYDITAVDAAGDEAWLSGNVTLSVPLPEGFNSADSCMYWFNDAGKATKIDATYSDGYMVASISDFGVYVITAGEYVVDNEGDNEIIYGDANGDGTVNSKDAVLYKKYMAGFKDIEIHLDACDVNDDNAVDSKDVVKVLQYMAGMDVVLGNK